MTTEEFRASLENAVPPAELSAPLAAMWWDARGDWHQAHEAAQQGNDAASAWVHAYLHRKEGDAGNAAYWYSIARKPVFKGSFDVEAAAMVQELLRA